MPRLVVESGVDKGMVFPLVGEITSLGRSAQNNIQIIDKRMSRHHVEFLRQGARSILKDLGSKNGTWLNADRVTGEHQLKNGDRVRIGETVLLFEADPDEQTSPISRPSAGVKLVQEDWSSGSNLSNTMVAGAAPLAPDKIAEAGARYKEDKQARIQLLFEVADAIRTIFDLDELLARIMDLGWSALEPDTGVIFLVDEKTNRFYPCITRDQRDEATKKGELTVSRSIIDRAASERVSILVSDAPKDQRFNTSESIIMHRIRSALCAPIIHKDSVLGVLYVATQRFVEYSQDDLELLTGIANQAAMAISNVKLHNQLVQQQKFEKEMEIARTIQMNLLPKEYPEFTNFQLSAMSLPAKHVGGDYYDFIKLTDGRTAVAIADVSGKGVPAALLTTTVRASMQVVARHLSLSTPDLMKSVNEAIFGDSLNNMYVTMVYAVVDDEKRKIEFTNAGHAHPILFLPDGTERPLIKGGSFLGIDLEMEFESEGIDLPPQSVLVLYTDGITDTTDDNNQQFGQERFRRVVRENVGKSAEEIRDAIYEATLAFRGATPQFDDFTLIVLKCVQ